ncbi:MAG: GAF domain-containing protein [Bacilli bacterium]|nr:GAF domain-containing protein [Bacilli bacterium]
MNDIDLRPLLQAILPSLQAMNEEKRLKAAHLGNALSLLHSSLGEDSWVGIYAFDGDALILGHFQGSMACEIIAVGKGVVGEAFAKNETILVEDVSTWPNYICCDAKAKSEICVPLRGKDGTAFAILDIDLPYVHDFAKEKDLFEQVAEVLCRFF